MKNKLLIFFLVLGIVMSYGSLQKVNDTNKEKKTNTLPPDVGSNKYSKKKKLEPPKGNVFHPHSVSVC